MPSLNTIPSSVDVWRTRLHRSVDPDGPLLTNCDSGALRKFRRRSNTYANKHEIGRRFKSFRIGNTQFSLLQFVDRLDLPSAEDSHSFPVKFLSDELSEFGIHGGQNLARSTDQSDVQAAVYQGIRHFQADVPGADNHRRLWILIG